MYPSDELKRLALRKHLLVIKSTVLRAQCVAAVQHLSPPIVVTEGWIGLFKKAFPYLQFASSLFTFRKKASPGGIWEFVQKWAAILLQAFKWFKSAAARPEQAKPGDPQ